jgi:hypothetical protein
VLCVAGWFFLFFCGMVLVSSSVCIPGEGSGLLCFGVSKEMRFPVVFAFELIWVPRLASVWGLGVGFTVGFSGCWGVTRLFAYCLLRGVSLFWCFVCDFIGLSPVGDLAVSRGCSLGGRCSGGVGGCSCALCRGFRPSSVEVLTWGVLVLPGAFIGFFWSGLGFAWCIFGCC